MSSKSSNLLNKKEIVTSLMTYIGRETKIVLGENNERITKTYIKYKCPSRACPQETITFLENSEYENAYAHLRSCFGRGKHLKEQEETILQMYRNAKILVLQKGGSIRSHFDVLAQSEYEKAMCAYVNLVINKNMPISLVEDEELGNFFKFDVKVSRKALVEIIFKLVDLVEKQISKEMKTTKGAVMFDSRSCMDIHYTGVIASYCVSMDVIKDEKRVSENIQRLALLAVAPMASLEEDVYEEDETLNDEATSCNAATYIQFTRDIFRFYNQNFDDWTVCMIGDNCKVNLKIANDLRKPHVGCNNQKLNLEVNRMIGRSEALNNVIESVHGTMKDMTSLKSTAILRNRNSLKPVMCNVTRWTDKYLMLQQFLIIYNDLADIKNNMDGNLYVDTSAYFKKKVEAYADMLSEINVVTKALQTRGLTLASCRETLTILVDAINEEQHKHNSKLYKCPLESNYISDDSDIISHPHFESGVVKIQQGVHSSLTEEEKQAVLCLKLSSSNNNLDSELANSDRLSMSARLAKKRQLNNAMSQYMNCDFILGSATEIEQVWSICKYILAENCCMITPYLFESIVFLRYNNRLWDNNLIVEAIHMARSTRTNSLLASDSAFINMQE